MVVGTVADARGPAGDHALQFPDKNVDGTGKDAGFSNWSRDGRYVSFVTFGGDFIACPRNRSPIKR